MTKIELLGPALLNNHRLLHRVKDIEKRLVLDLGWHYYLDLIWCRKQLPDDVKGLTILDAGAGRGLMQWWLASEGATVISVDKGMQHGAVPRRFRQWCEVEGFRPGELEPHNDPLNLISFLPPRYLRGWAKKIRKTGMLTRRRKGRVQILRHALDDPGLSAVLADGVSWKLPTLKVDHVISISALEHNSVDTMEASIANLMGCIKSGGKLIATVCASRDIDWYHDFYNAQCLTIETLMRLLRVSGRENFTTNWSKFDAIFDAVVNCQMLRERTRHWNPTYQPVGIVKVAGE